MRAAARNPDHHISVQALFGLFQTKISVPINQTMVGNLYAVPLDVKVRMKLNTNSTASNPI
jgi:hypothetical protein